MRQMKIEDFDTWVDVCARLTERGIAFTAWDKPLNQNKLYLIEIEGY